MEITFNISQKFWSNSFIESLDKVEKRQRKGYIQIAFIF